MVYFSTRKKTRKNKRKSKQLCLVQQLRRALLDALSDWRCSYEDPNLYKVEDRDQARVRLHISM